MEDHKPEGQQENVKPEKPEEALSSEDLDKVAGGNTIGGSASGGSTTHFEIANPDPWGVTQPGGPNRPD